MSQYLKVPSFTELRASVEILSAIISSKDFSVIFPIKVGSPMAKDIKKIAAIMTC